VRLDCRVVAVIPALNEEKSLGAVLDRIPTWVDRVVVADNGSTDATARVARERGAEVVHEEQRGYGAACQAGLATLRGRMRSEDVVVFLDADGSDDPEEMTSLVDPLLRGEADLVIGARTNAERMPWHQRFGTALVARLLTVCFGARVTDLGPYRAIHWSALVALQMRDMRFGWTAEMQARALRQRRRILEVPVRWRPGAGRSAISGSLAGSLRAGHDLTRAVLSQAIAAQRDRAFRGCHREHS
jgi:glycosyltransferase involved in cell wall biosynthesis